MIGEHQTNIVDPDQQFTTHAYHAVFSNKLSAYKPELQDDMVIAVAEHIINQIRPEFRNKFLNYVRVRIEAN